MTSVQLDSLILAYFSGSVGEAELARLDQVLKADESARERFARLAGQEIDLRDVVVERLAPLRMARRRMVARLRLWAPLAAAASLMAILGWWALRGGPDTGLAPAMAAVTELRVEQTTGATRTDSERTQQTLRIGDLVRPGTTVETAAGQSLALVGRDGMTRLDLAAGTRLEWHSADTTSTTLHLARGELAARIGLQTPGHAWLFGTPHADIRVVGTQLRMLTESDQTRVDVDDGRVEVKPGSATTWVPVAAGQTAILSGTEEKGTLALLGEILFEDTFENRWDQWDMEVVVRDDIVAPVPADDPLRQTVRTVEMNRDGTRITCLEVDGLAAKGQNLNLVTRQRFPMRGLVMEVEYIGLAFESDNEFTVGCAVNVPLEIEPVTKVLFMEPALMRRKRWHTRRGEYRPSVNERGGLDILSKNYLDGRYIFAHRISYESAADKQFHLFVKVRNSRMRIARITVRRLLDTP